MDEIIKQRLSAAGWHIPEEVWNCLPPDEQEWLLLEMTGMRTLDYYQKRVQHLGFTQMEAVLDAACGIGQWSVALSHLNGQIAGVDIHFGRLWVATTLTQSLQRPNCTFRYSTLEKLPFPPAAFDGIFCYSAFMFTKMPEVLAEFYRVLRPGGRVYLNANHIGWYAHLFIDRGLKQRNRSLIKATTRIALRTLLRKTQNIIVTPRWLFQTIKTAGFQLVASGLEGEIDILDNPADKPPSAYPSHYYGLPAIVEVLIEKAEKA